MNLNEFMDVNIIKNDYFPKQRTQNKREESITSTYLLTQQRLKWREVDLQENKYLKAIQNASMPYCRYLSSAVWILCFLFSEIETFPS